MSHSYSKAASKMDTNQVVLKYTIPHQSGDTHTCSACQIQFTSIEDYIKHKQIHGTVPQNVAIADVIAAKHIISKTDLGHVNNKSVKDKDQTESVVKIKDHQTQEQIDLSVSADKVLHIELDHIQNKDTNNGQQNVSGGKSGKPVTVFVQAKPPTAVMTTVKEVLPSKPVPTTSWPAPKFTKKFKCNLCNKLLKDYASWKGHKLTHTQQREWICCWPECTYAFKTKGSLKRHMRRHTDERPFVCELCHRSFRESGALTRHLKARNPCTSKSDADFPKYGKKLSFSQDIPAAHSKPPSISLAATSVIPIAQEAGPTPQEVNLDQPKDAEPAVGSAVRSDQMIGSMLPVVQEVKKVHVKRVKLVIVIDSKTGQPMKVAIPVHDSVENETVPKPSINQESKVSVSNTTQNAPEEIAKQENRIIDNDLNTTSKPSEKVKIDTPIEDIVNNDVKINDAKTIDNLNNVDSKHLVKSIKSDSASTKYKSEEFNSINEGLDEENDGSDLDTSSPTDFKAPNIAEQYIGEEEGSYFGLEDTPDSSGIEVTRDDEFGMSTEVVTSADLVTSTVILNGSDEDEAMEIDQDQGVPLTNRKKCQACGSYCGDEEALKVHLKTHLIPAGYKCPVATCKYIAQKKQRLSLHLKVTHRSQPDQVKEVTEPKGDDHVEIGGDVTVSDINMAIKQLEPDGEDTEECEPSNVDIETANTALRQLLELQGNLDTQVLLTANNQAVGVLHGCPVCDRKFTLNYLKLHIRAHTGEKPHKCPHCDKTFRTKDTLNKHVSCHSDVRNYKCGECGKMFKRISHAREHLKVHSHDRPFVCTLCGKGFKSANGCKVHLRTHSEYLAFECKVCGKRFREKSGLDRHSRTHTGEKPYTCLMCGRGFAEHGTLSRHMKAKVPCTASVRKLWRTNEKSEIEPVSNPTTPTLQQIKTTENSIENGTQVTNQIWVGDQVEIAPITKNEEIKTQTTQDLSLIISQGQNVSNVQNSLTDVKSEGGSANLSGDTVLAEFSTVVADTQQYIVGQNDVQVMELPENNPESLGQVEGDAEYINNTGSTIITSVNGEAVIHPSGQYIVMNVN